MRNLRRLIHPTGALALGALVLGLLGVEVTAGNGPKAGLLWPANATLFLQYYGPGGLYVGPRLHISWPVANGADHYRLTVVRKAGNGYQVIMDSSPATPSTLYTVYGTYLITVTAYDGPNEDTAYSESIQAQFKTPRAYSFP